jgi:hypothetical protein
LFSFAFFFLSPFPFSFFFLLLFFLSPWGCGHPSDFFWEKMGHFAFCFLEVPSKMDLGPFFFNSQKIHHVQRNCF